MVAPQINRSAYADFLRVTAIASAGTMTETQVYLKVCKAAQYDRYGFRQAAPELPGSAPSTSGQQSRLTGPENNLDDWRQARRLAKWQRMLSAGAARLPSYAQQKFAKLKRRVRKGVPQQYRGLVWHVLSGMRYTWAHTESLRCKQWKPFSADRVSHLCMCRRALTHAAQRTWHLSFTASSKHTCRRRDRHHARLGSHLSNQRLLH